MRRIVQTCLCLALSGCGYNTWSELPFSTGTNPNMPVDNSENMRRAMGEVVEVQPLTTEPGDVWPGAMAPTPTLEDIVEFSRDRLASYKKPTVLVVIDALPRNASGKVLKHELRSRYGSGELAAQ